jgi:hypothetical protein
MTVEIEWSAPQTLTAVDWQISMAKQIEENRGFPIEEIEREFTGCTLIVRVETDLPSQAVEGMLSDIEEHLPNGSQHVETREV